MSNQVIKVPDISIVVTVDGVKQLQSLRNQMVEKDGRLQNFRTESGIICQGNLYVLECDLIPIVRLTTKASRIGFSVNENIEIETDWGDGRREKNVFVHNYEDGLTEHEIVIWGKKDSLTEFACYNNQLTSLDISANPNLEMLQCHYNQLTLIDVSNNPKLTIFACYNNQLTLLNVSNNPNLNYVQCQNNQLTSLNIFNTPKLQSINCTNNPLLTNQFVVRELADSLPLREENNKGQLVLNNSISATWIQSICIAKNWEIS